MDNISFKKLIESQLDEIAPIMGYEINAKKMIVFNGSNQNEALNNIDLSNVEAFSAYAFDCLEKANAVASIGGYLEKRIIYSATPYFENSERDIHLGVDIFTKANSPLFAPLTGSVHSFANNAGHGNYGGTIVLEHEINGFKFHTLYGHLSVKSLEDKFVGQKIYAGELFCEIGNYPENGNWPPHLHFQIIIDMENNEGDYVGVAAEKDIAFYKINCPNPNLILRSNLLSFN